MEAAAQAKLRTNVPVPLQYNWLLALTKTRGAALRFPRPLPGIFLIYQWRNGLFVERPFDRCSVQVWLLEFQELAYE